MKKRSTLVLMELAIMLLVFALAAAICLQAFARAERLSAKTRQADEAASLARSAAEVIKAARGDLSRAAALLGAEANGEELTGSSEDLDYIAKLVPSDVKLLGKAEVQVMDETGGILFVLPVAWQKEGAYD